MKTTYSMILVLALGAPLAAGGLSAPELPLIDAAMVRAQSTAMLPAAAARDARADNAALKSGPATAYNIKVSAYGALFQYNRNTKKYDVALNQKCSVTVSDFKNFIDTEHGSPEATISARYELRGLPESLGKYAKGGAQGPAPAEYFPVVSLTGSHDFELASGVTARIELNNARSTQEFFSRPISISRAYLTSENSATAYFGGNGVKWGYMCDVKASAAY